MNERTAENAAHNAGCAITHGYNACTCATFADNAEAFFRS